MATKIQKFLIFALIISLFLTGTVSAAEAASDEAIGMIVIVAIAFVVGVVFLKVGLPIIIGLIILGLIIAQLNS